MEWTNVRLEKHTFAKTIISMSDAIDAELCNEKGGRIACCCSLTYLDAR